MANQINCPKCNHEIVVNEVMQTQLTEQIRKDIESELHAKQAEVLTAKNQLAAQQAALATEKNCLLYTSPSPRD